MPELGGQGGYCPHPPQYLADQLTLFQPGEGRLPTLITKCPLKFFHLPASLQCYQETRLFSTLRAGVPECKSCGQAYVAGSAELLQNWLGQSLILQGNRDTK